MDYDTSLAALSTPEPSFDSTSSTARIAISMGLVEIWATFRLIVKHFAALRTEYDSLERQNREVGG